MVWVHEPANLAFEVPVGWSANGDNQHGIWLENPDIPAHRLSIQRMTLDLGHSPLRLLKESFGKHSHFTEFHIEKSWAEPIEGMWSPAFIATYRYLDVPCIRYGRLLATDLGFYEIAYHAPLEPHSDAISAYEHLLGSMTHFRED